MSTVESCRDRQKNEFEVLKSIYYDELQDLRKSKNNKKWHPMDIVLTLTPQKGMSGPSEIHAQIDMHVICGEDYPNQVPVIKLKNSKGLSNEQIAVLSSELENLAERRKGEEMIYDMAQHVEQFLHKHNKPVYNSFYEEMVSRQKELNDQRQSLIQEMQLQQDKERQILQDEILKRQEALKAELKNQRDKPRKLSESAVTLASQSIPSSPQERVRNVARRRCMSTSETSVISTCEHKGTELLDFHKNQIGRRVYRGKCLGHSSKGSVVYIGVDDPTGEPLAITEWLLKCGATGGNEKNEVTDPQHTMKQVVSIEQELNYLHRIQHPNLVRYLGIKYEQIEDTIRIYILEEFVVGTSCTFFLSENIPMGIDILRHIANGVLTALQCLHKNNVVHRDLRDSSIHIGRSGCIKVSDYALNKKLSDIYKSSCLAKAEQDFPTIQGKGGKKSDIYRFGIILSSLIDGSIITEKEQMKEWSGNVPPELRDFLSKCLDDDERVRWSAEQLLQHSFIQTPIERRISPLKLPKPKNVDSGDPEESSEDYNLYIPKTFNNRGRVYTEFEVLKWLGKGAYGDVIKVKNKLDSQIYAIKRIPLNSENKQLNKKITREVKLLSRLKHDNVVRYYNSWIESAVLDDSSLSSTQNTTRDVTPATSSPSVEPNKMNIPLPNLDCDVIEKKSPPKSKSDWNMSFECTANLSESEESGDDSDSDEEGWGLFQKASTGTDSSDGIVFMTDDPSQQATDTQLSLDNDDESDLKEESSEDEPDSQRETQCLYIQMEFCEKSTLKTAIDNGLYAEEERVWRLFREIIEGIVHIHQQGMIHRDLKPVNIFLDSNDHVKIGDFGLATIDRRMCSERKVPLIERAINFDTDEPSAMTGEIGTALYTAPELSAKTAKAIYNQKVDMYSLGIILFEMFCKPLNTGMERVKILSDVRSKDIVLPQEFIGQTKPNVVKLLRWLLNHDPSQRPTSQELLDSQYLPPPQLEEAELQEMVRHALSNQQSQAYKHLMGACFSQETTVAENITYDRDIRPPHKPSSVIPNDLFREYVKSKICEVFRKHGGQYFSTPLLTPISKKFQFHSPEITVKLMTKAGYIVSLPSDLRAPFARYVAWNNIHHMRRYVMERVYRETNLCGVHPIESYECAFDVIETSVDYMVEAQLIYMVWDIINNIPELRERSYVVRMNHPLILQAVLMYCDIDPEKYQDIYTVLYDARDRKFTKYQVQTHLISLCLSDNAMSFLSNLLDTDNGPSVDQITELLKTITRNKGSEAAKLANEGWQQIQKVKQIVETLGINWPIIIAPLVVHKPQHQYSGVIYQITCEPKKKRKRVGYDVIAFGGRYDDMLASFRQIMGKTNGSKEEIKQHGVGVTISLQRLVQAVIKESTKENGNLSKTGRIQENLKQNIDLLRFGVYLSVAVVCLIQDDLDDDRSIRRQEFITIMKELWGLGYGVIALNFPTIDNALLHCRENFITHVVILRSGDRGNLRVYSYERDRYQEKRMNVNDIVEHFVNFKLRSENSPLPALNRSDSKSYSGNDSITTNITISFVRTDRERMSGSSRKNYKNAITAQLTADLWKFSSKVEVQIFAVWLNFSVVKIIVSLLEVDEIERDFLKSVQQIIESCSGNKKYIQEICNEMWEVREKRNPTLVLYSLNDNRYQYLI